MRNARKLALLVLSGSTGIVLAQAAAPLPPSMSGRWTTVVPGNRTFTDSLSIALDVPSGAGPLTGRLTLHGVTCGASNEPLTGTWDGNELRLESKVRPNVNSQRVNGDCGTGHITFKLTRKPGQTAFEGEAVRDASPFPTQITLTP